MNDFLTAGLDFLQQKQQPDGNFLSFSSPRRSPFESRTTYQTVFPAALILSCLTDLPESPERNSIQKRLADFLLEQKSPHWSFNYWDRHSHEARQRPYPDDLDDTFCALAALTRYNPELIQGEALAQIVKLLTAAEKEVGGPYQTWLVPPTASPAWHDVDVVVNSNVAYFLSLHNIVLPKLINFIEAAAQASQYQSRYYPSEHAVIYFISRFYRGSRTEKMRADLWKLHSNSEHWGNSLLTALSVSALLNFGEDPSTLTKSIEYLEKESGQHGFEAEAFCLDPVQEGIPYYAGSPALTTAYCLEAKAKYQAAYTAEPLPIHHKHPRPTHDSRATILSQRIVHATQDRLAKLSLPIRDIALEQLERIRTIDQDQQIVLLPYFFEQALHEKRESVSTQLLTNLGQAHLYGWLAYTLYDDFFDNEGDPQVLSVANLSLRTLTKIVETVLPAETGFASWFHRTLDTLDNANTWEVLNCRFTPGGALPVYGEYTMLADRSLGHALGPVALLCARGYREESLEIQSIINFFRHYLSARQLNDDMHDWEKDWHQGHLSPVVTLLLKRYQDQYHTLPTLVSEDVHRMRKLFWFNVVREICHHLAAHADQAEQALATCSVIKNPTYFEALLQPLQRSAQKTLTEQQTTVDFLQSYKA